MRLKQTRTTALASVLLVAGLVFGTVITTPSADAARVRIQGAGQAANANDIKVIDAFTDSYEQFIDGVAQASATTGPSNAYTVLTANNDTLQAHSFKELNDAYKTATDAVKQEARAIVSLAGEVNADSAAQITNKSTTVARLNDAMDVYNTRLTAMTSAVEKYNQDKKTQTENSNRITGIVVGAIIGVIVLLVVIGLVVGGKKRKTAATTLFNGDPSVAAIDASYRKAVSSLYNGLLRYEKDMKQPENKTLLELDVKSSYDPYIAAATHESLGKYRAVASEYAALIAYANGRREDALRHLDQAAAYLGHRQFYTETARSIQ